MMSLSESCFLIFTQLHFHSLWQRGKAPFPRNLSKGKQSWMEVMRSDIMMSHSSGSPADNKDVNSQNGSVLSVFKRIKKSHRMPRKSLFNLLCLWQGSIQETGKTRKYQSNQL